MVDTAEVSKKRQKKLANRHPIKLFQFNQKFCQLIGIEIQNGFTLNSKNVIIITCLVQLAMASTAFWLQDSTSMEEYGISFITLICVGKCLVDYFILIWKMGDISKFVENCEGLIATSKS